MNTNPAPSTKKYFDKGEQIKVLRERGYTVRQIAKMVGLKSPGAVQFYIKRLKQGYKSRSILVEENQRQFDYISTLEKVIEQARYEGDMGRGEFTHLCIEAGLTRLDRCLNILKFKDPEFSSLTIK